MKELLDALIIRALLVILLIAFAHWKSTDPVLLQRVLSVFLMPQGSGNPFTRMAIPNCKSRRSPRSTRAVPLSLSVHVRAQHSMHSGQMPATLRFEESDNVRINTHVDLLLSERRLNFSVIPKPLRQIQNFSIFSSRFGLTLIFHRSQCLKGGCFCIFRSHFDLLSMRLSAGCFHPAWYE